MKAMKTMPETSWRQSMWTELMRRPPANVTINLKTKSYALLPERVYRAKNYGM